MDGPSPASALASAEALAGALLGRVDEPARSWLAQVYAGAADADRETFLGALAAAGRRLGRTALVVGRADPDESRLAEAGITLPPEGWGLDEAGRAALLLKRLGVADREDRTALANEVFYRGEVRERQALLRILAYLPDPGRLIDIAREACRTSVDSLFRAIACDNPYPAEHFDDEGFNQMVLKAVFVGAPVSRIVGLVRRATPEMRRMAEDYAAERRAAGRVVPEDVSLILSTR
jgi:hypothetical protein